MDLENLSLEELKNLKVQLDNKLKEINNETIDNTISLINDIVLCENNRIINERYNEFYNHIMNHPNFDKNLKDNMIKIFDKSLFKIRNRELKTIKYTFNEVILLLRPEDTKYTLYSDNAGIREIYNLKSDAWRKDLFEIFYLNSKTIIEDLNKLKNKKDTQLDERQKSLFELFKDMFNSSYISTI
jgi:hypothetical protein